MSAPRKPEAIAHAATEVEDHEGIDVTPEMIAAGCAELATFDYRYEAEEDAVERIYRAMATLGATSSRGRGKTLKRRA
jgi:hypothetical protein